MLKGSLFLVLPAATKKLELVDYKVTIDNDTKILTWKDKKNKDSVNLTLKNGTCTGMIYLEDKVYSVKSLGENLHVVNQVDQNKMIDR